MQFNERELKETIYGHIVRKWGKVMDEEYNKIWIYPKIHRIVNYDKLFNQRRLFLKKNMKPLFLLRKKFNFNLECCYMLECLKLN